MKPKLCLKGSFSGSKGINVKYDIEPEIARCPGGLIAFLLGEEQWSPKSRAGRSDQGGCPSGFGDPEAVRCISLMAHSRRLDRITASSVLPR
jgi:hypothetical protein